MIFDCVKRSPHPRAHGLCLLYAALDHCNSHKYPYSFLTCSLRNLPLWPHTQEHCLPRFCRIDCKVRKPSVFQCSWATCASCSLCCCCSSFGSHRPTGPPTSWSTSVSAPCQGVSPCLPPRASGWRPKTSSTTTHPVSGPSVCAWCSWLCSAAASSSNSGTSTRRLSASTRLCLGPSTTSCSPPLSCQPRPSSFGNGAMWAWWTSWVWPVVSPPSPLGLSLYRCSKSSISTLGK